MLFSKCDKCYTEVDANTLTEKVHWVDGATTRFRLCEKCIKEPIPAGAMFLNENRR